MADTDSLDSAATSLAALKAGTVDLTSAASTFAKTMSDAFSSSVSDGQKFGDLLSSLASKIGALGSGSTSSIGSGLQSIASNLTGGSGVTAFASGGVVGTPSYFPMEGGTGLVGEAGPEAILPLQRGADGSLGVAAQGGGSTIQVQIATPDAASFRRSESYVSGQIARAVARGQRSL